MPDCATLLLHISSPASPPSAASMSPDGSGTNVTVNSGRSDITSNSDERNPHRSPSVTVVNSQPWFVSPLAQA